jgi:hypothetical protein
MILYLSLALLPLLPLGAITLDEPRISLREAARIMGVHLATAYRWSQRGIGGVRLEVIQCGQKLQTTKTALEEFCRRLTARRDGLPVEGAAVTSRQRERQKQVASEQAQKLIG